MPKYILIYKNDEAFDTASLPEEEVTKQMEAWGEWLGNIGSSVVDEGDAFKTGAKSVSSKGVSDADELIGGYSIIEAESIDAALEHARKCPAVTEGGHVQVYEAFGL